MRSLTIYAPGVLGPWPADDSTEFPRPKTPVLQRMLARGDRLPHPPVDFETGLARLFGHADADLPWGALGLWGETGERPEGFVLRVDPVHLKLGMTDAIIFGGPSMQLAMKEACALAQALEEHFTERGWRITVAAADRWYLQLPESSDLRTAPLSRVLGRNAGLFKPLGTDAARWLADLTEAQMLLHSHPVNQDREARGLPAINSLWPWGAGALPVPNKLPATIERVFSNHPLACGLAHAAGLPVDGLPETYGEWMDVAGEVAHALVVLDDAFQPWQEGDQDDWLATVEGLEARWFAPLWSALARGQWQQVILDSAEGGVCRFTRTQRWRFWRRSKPLESLCAPTA